MLNVRSSLPEENVTLPDGTAIGCFSSGSGPLNLLLLHGLNSYSGTWKKNVDVLSTVGNVCAPTLPKVDFSGGSSLYDAVVSLSEIVLKLIITKGWSRVTIVGNSMGGWLGLHLALNYSGLVRGLVLVDSAGITEDSDSQEVHPAVMDRMLNRISQPVLIVWGEEDRLIPLSAAETLHERISGSRLEVIRGAGHIPHLEKAEEFNRIILSFLSENMPRLISNR